MTAIISNFSVIPFGILFGVDLHTIIVIIFIVFYVIFHGLASIESARETVRKRENKAQNQNQNQDIQDIKDGIATNQSTNQSSGFNVEQDIIYKSKPSENKRKRNFRKSQPQIPNEIISTTNYVSNESKSQRKVLSRELPQQGQGVRFNAAPGTLNTVLAPSVEATVNPELESLTGIYDQPELDTNNNNIVSDTIKFSLNDFLTTPDGIKNSFILSEILNRPKF
ncbi:MAG: hypothetical protein LBE18_02005 [Planctomycetaceae bacterium]|jgi:hypothetical protein|nr:hypothetical protein [Planctomycetaceae bacterium]